MQSSGARAHVLCQSSSCCTLLVRKHLEDGMQVRVEGVCTSSLQATGLSGQTAQDVCVSGVGLDEVVAETG